MSGFIGTKLTMNLGERSYDIILKNGALENLYQFARLDRKVAVVTDSGVPAEYAQSVADQCRESTVITVPQGEGSKCLKVYGQVLPAMLEFDMGRGDLLVAVGGGVVGDLAAFALPATCAASTLSTAPRPPFPGSIPPSAARPLWIWARRRTSSARSGSPSSSSSILTPSRPCPAARSSTAWPRRSRPASWGTRSCLPCLKKATPRTRLNRFTAV